MAEDNQDGSAATTSPPMSWSSRAPSPPSSRPMSPCPDHTYNAIGAGFGSNLPPRPEADPEYRPHERVTKRMPPDELWATFGSPHGVSSQASDANANADVDANADRVAGSDTASDRTTRPGASTASPRTSTASTSEADGDAPLPAETSMSTFDLPDRRAHVEDDSPPTARRPRGKHQLPRLTAPPAKGQL